MCYGNIYRSPFVASVLKDRLRGADNFEVRSAGFHPRTERPSPEDYVELVRDRQIDLTPHRSSLVTAADLEWAEAIVIMDRYNWERLQPFGAEIGAKILWLGAFARTGPLEVQDPYGLPTPRVQAIVTQMQAAAEGLAENLLKTRSGSV
jgi:protein-tyrosine phosphatase